MRRLTFVVAVGLAIVASTSSSASAQSGELTQLPGAAACVQNTGGDVACSLGRALGETSFLTITPDGRHVYGVATNDDAVVSFSRDTASGSLTQLAGVDGCTSTTGMDDTGVAGTCRTAAGLDGARGLVVSPDGANVYVVAAEGHSVTSFSRNSVSGSLTQIGCISDGTDTGCSSTGRLLGDVRDIQISPDGRFLYASATDTNDLTTNSLTVYARAAGTGALTAVTGAAGCVNLTGDDGSGAGSCTKGRAFHEPSSSVISPDGKFLYLTASEGITTADDGSVLSFSRDLATGQLTQLAGTNGCLNERADDDSGVGTCAPGKGFHDANQIAISPNGTSIYTASQGDGNNPTPGTVGIFTRNTTTGVISQLPGTTGCISLDGSTGNGGGAGECALARGLVEVTGVTVAPDGKTVYATGSDSAVGPPVEAAAIAVFARSASNGALTQLAGAAGCVSDAVGSDSQGGTTCTPAVGVRGANQIVLSQDCRSLYLASQDTPAGIAAFSRSPACDPPPPTVPPVTPPTTPPTLPACTSKFTSKLQLARATFSRKKRTISILAPITKRASGSVRISLNAAGRTKTFSAKVDSKKGRVRITKKIPAAQARLGTGILTIRYPGDADTRAQTVRLRAANGKAKLTVTRPTITPTGFLKASGKVSSRARGIVRVQLEYVNRADGLTVTLRRNTTIKKGRWKLNSRLSPSLRSQIALRCGTVHSYTLFTGYFPRRIRGEMRSLQVLPDA